MAVEIPTSLIRQIQDVLRKEAGVPEFDPADPAVPGLRSFEEAISGLDASAPPYLRCKECRGPLLRGLLSTGCVYCGAEQRRDPPLSISFSATLGCRKLLQSLDLDGSEVVELNTKSKDSGEGQGTEKGGLVLSSLLDIELRWPSEEEKEVQTNSTSNAPTQSTLNLSGVDLDNFFSETKKEAGSDAHHVSDEILVPHEETDLEDFGLFEELCPIDKAVSYVVTKPSDTGDPSGAWEAEFRSAPSHISSTDPGAKDLFQDSVSINYASATVGEQINVESEVNREDKNTVFSSNSSQVPCDDWPLDVPWHTTDSVVPDAAEQFSGKSNTDGGELKPNSMAHDWAQTDIWPTSSTSIPSTNQNMQTNDDSFDEWQDFTSSGNEPDASSSSWTQVSTAVTLSNEHESGTSSMNITDRLEDEDFGSFVQSDLLPGLSDVRIDSSKLGTVQSEASVSGRMREWEKTAMNGDIWPMSDKNEILSSTPSAGTAKADVQDLLSQMDDLSFMLENDLYIPKKVEPSD